MRAAVGGEANVQILPTQDELPHAPLRTGNTTKTHPKRNQTTPPGHQENYQSIGIRSTNGSVGMSVTTQPNVRRTFGWDWWDETPQTRKCQNWIGMRMRHWVRVTRLTSASHIITP